MAQGGTQLSNIPHLIVCFNPDANVRSVGEKGIISTSHDVSSIQDILEKHSAQCSPLFGSSEERIHKRQADTLSAATESGCYKDYDHPLANLPDLSCFYRVHCANESVDHLAETLSKEEYVDAAYAKPPTYLPIPFQLQKNIGTPAPTTTPNFVDSQIYLNPAPAGIDAKLAWVLPGGGGAGVKIIDCENGWNFDHEDLLNNQGGVAAGSSATDGDNVNHGTAVLGEISGDRNPFGITGIAPDSTISASSWYSVISSTAIRAAADKLESGSIILLEGHRPGPSTPDPKQGQIGYIPVEWWPDDFLAIQYAIAKGIIVVVAAGNGDQNLDDPIYDTPWPVGSTFPSWWKNPLNPKNPSSGSIMIGAGQPPPGTHGRQTRTDRSRCHYPGNWGSNYGTRLCAQGWGLEVTTSGYGSLQTGISQNIWYADEFAGTSSASPIVVGALLCIQGALKARGRRLLTPSEAALLLQAHGSPQQADDDTPATQKIGKRPNLRVLIPAASKWKSRSAKFDGTGKASIVITSSSKVALLQQNGNGMSNPVIVSANQMLTGGWRINPADNFLGPVANFSGNGPAETFVVSPWGIGMLKASGATLAASTITKNGTRIGDWLLNTVDNCFGPAADYDGDGTAEIIASSPWGIGILKKSGTAMAQVMAKPNGTRFGEWLLNTADNEFCCTGTFSGASGTAAKKSEVLAVSPWGIAILQYSTTAKTFQVLSMKANGTRIGGWLLNTADNRFGPVGDYDGDGKDEILVTSPWGIGLLKLVGGEITVPMMQPNGTRFGGWLLNTVDNSFGPCRDMDGDSKVELVVVSPWGMGLLKQNGSTMTPVVMYPNGTRLGQWLLNTADDTLGTTADFDNDGKAEILTTSPWGMGILKLVNGNLTSTVMVPNGQAVGGWVVDTPGDDFGHGF